MLAGACLGQGRKALGRFTPIKAHASITSMENCAHVPNSGENASSVWIHDVDLYAKFPVREGTETQFCMRFGCEKWQSAQFADAKHHEPVILYLSTVSNGCCWKYLVSLRSGYPSQRSATSNKVTDSHYRQCIKLMSTGWWHLRLQKQRRFADARIGHLFS